MTGEPQLDLTQVQHLLGSHRIGSHLRHEIECSSTNDLAKQMMESGAPCGAVVIAESQTAGRGRFQRSWTSARGLNLLFTIVVRWHRGAFEPQWLTFVAALAVRHTVATLYSLDAGIKWPNDVVLTLGDGVQKLAGTLTETATVGGDEQGAVVGIGLNVNQVWDASEQDPQCPRISLAAALGRPLDREPLLAACLTSFEERLETLEQGDTAALVAEVRAHLTGLGRRVEIVIPGRSWKGVVSGLDDDGHLLLKDTEGQIRSIAAGEVLFPNAEPERS